MEIEKTYFYQFEKDGRWWDKPHRLTEQEAKAEFGYLKCKYRKHLFANNR